MSVCVHVCIRMQVRVSMRARKQPPESLLGASSSSVLHVDCAVVAPSGEKTLLLVSSHYYG